ncbi:MAG: lamin tail domain-containing protein, partial [Planctomycetota bacterium]
WKFDEGSGSTAYDSALSNDGTVYGATWTTGLIDGALSFDGNGDYVKVNDSLSMRSLDGSTAEYTISLWVKTTQTGAAPWDQKVIFERRATYPLSGINQWVAHIFLNENNATGFFIGEGGGNNFFLNDTMAINDGNWHHITATRKNTEYVRVYVDGTLRKSGSTSFNPYTTEITTIAVRRTNTNTFTGYFDGIIDDVRIYDHALSEDEIEAFTPDADLDGDNDVDWADFALLCANWQKEISRQIVINELHTDPDVKTEQVEFVELHNISSESIDLSGWYFSRGFDYTFPPGSSVAGDGYVVICENSNPFDPNTLSDADFVAKFGFSPDGIFVGKLDNDGENVELRNAQGDEVDQVDYQLGFPWPTVGDPVPFAYEPDGSGHSMQLVYPGLDNDLGGSWRSAYPTPGAKNTAVFSKNIPPHIRQVAHSPEQPTSSDTVTITCKVTDPDGVASVTLKYQLVNPGSYIPITLPNYSVVNSPLTNPAYENPANWSSSVTMYDDGTNGDEVAYNNIYTAQLSAVAHRSLVRYRITVEDNDAYSVTVPYTDDPVPNFAYFVYDGVPAWSGAINPFGSPPDNQVITYGTDVMRSLPVYHLISRKSDVEDCCWALEPTDAERYTLWHPHRKDFKWAGTLVYDGDVYDHVNYRLRGGTHRYNMCKNMWKFDFKRGHYFRARDDYGQRYGTSWDKLNFSACIQQNSTMTSGGYRGEHGMFEAISNMLFKLAGVPVSNNNWLQFRIIDEAAEAGPDQYEGDFWGLYMTLEQMDGRFLDEHGLLDSNLYKMFTETDNGLCERNNQGPTGVTDYSDVFDFVNAYKTYPATAWWLANVDVNSYWSYRTVIEGIHHYDIGSGKNYFYYPNPVTDIWSVLPWDVDLTFGDENWDCGNHGLSPFKRYGLWGDTNLEIDRNNRIREICDLLFNFEQEYQLIHEYASAVYEPNAAGLAITDADRAMWDYNPKMDDPDYTAWPENAGTGAYYQRSPTGDFPGMVWLMKKYIHQRVRIGDPNESGELGLKQICYDADIPHTPIVTYIGNPNFPANNLLFHTTSFDDPQGTGTFAAMKWRIAEVEPGSVVKPLTESLQLISDANNWKYFKGTTSPSNPITTWRELGFNDSTWSEGNTPIGWGEEPNFLGTELTGMQYTYSSFYLRKKFTVTDLSEIKGLRLKAMYDDGFNVWINETEVLSQNMYSYNVPYNDYATTANQNEKTWFNFTLPDPQSYLTEGVNANVIAIQVQNSEYESTGDPTVNGSFELDDYGEQIYCHTEVGMGWTEVGTWVGVDAECGQPGVCTEDCRDPVAPDGIAYCFMQTNDTELYQVLDHNIVEGKEYTLLFDAALPWSSNADLVASLFYVDNGNHVEIDSNTIPLPSDNSWLYDESVSFTAAGAGQPYLGKKLGIKFNAPIPGDLNTDKWAFLDDVRLETDPPINPVLDGDCFIDVSLVAQVEESFDPNVPEIDHTGPGKYEIEALWESEDINDVNNSTITIPGSVVRADRTYRVRSRMKDDTGRWSHWSDPYQFVAGEPLSAGILKYLRITELMYNPPDDPIYNNDDFEFIELKNTGPNTLDLTYVSLSDGVGFNFADSNVTSLGPSEFVLVVSDQNAFKFRYGSSLNVAGQYIGNFANGGERVELTDYWNGTIAEFNYNDGRGWPLPADGAGHSLVPLNSALPGEPKGSLKYGGNWRASTYMYGSPGQDDPTSPDSIVINELMAHTDFDDPCYPDYDSNDWIELYNTSSSIVNLNSDWYLSDDIGTPQKWSIPSTMVLGYKGVSFDEVTGFHSPYPSGFGLDKDGEQVVLSYLPGTSEDRIVDCIRFKGQEETASLGRHPDGGKYWFHMLPTRNAANSDPCQPEVVISEIMYHPAEPNDEYIELYNTTASSVNLWNGEDSWRVRGIGDDDYYFPPSTSIPYGDRIIVVGFDPVMEPARLDVFESAYGTGELTPNVDIFGPWDGNLSNGSERFALEKAQAPDEVGQPPSWVIVDEVMYADYLPWPESPDGSGDALERLSAAADASGNDPNNWTAATPSPGSL